MLTCIDCVAKDRNSNYAMEMCKDLRDNNLCQKQVEILLARIAGAKLEIVDGEYEEAKNTHAIADHTDTSNERT